MLNLYVTIYSIIILINCASVLGENDQNTCNRICSNLFSYLPVVNGKSGVCERGCRLFDIIYHTGKNDINSTKTECLSSCKEAYGSLEYKGCILGCDGMMKEKESITILENYKRIYVMTDIEIIESDLLADPLIQKQLEMGYDFKIPETRIRTMPIELLEREIADSETKRSSGFFSCSGNQSMTTFLLAGAALFSSMMILLLSLPSVTIKSLDHTVDDPLLNEVSKYYCVDIGYDKISKEVIEEMSDSDIKEKLSQKC